MATKIEYLAPQSEHRGPQPIAAPIPTLTAYYRSAEDKHRFVSHLFDHMASHYDRLDRILGLGRGAWYRGQALRRAGLRPQQRVLDVAVGTGLVAREAVGIVGESTLVVGVDPSPGMLHSAKVPPGVRYPSRSATARLSF
jgi:demethylmenaquinone methyltransferase/2-methoxy-6-polyprenyl-1,4-benzoquinol methylase